MYPVQVESPAGGIAAAGEPAPSSVGVVITRDARLPLMAQSVVRAPGYTLRLDHRSGVVNFLLDTDGHRRHGHIRTDTGECTGMFAIKKGDDWILDLRICRSVLCSTDSITGARVIIIAPGRGDRVRPRYAFYEDRIVVTLTESDPNAEYEMWLGDFDTLGEPSLNATRMEQKGKETAYFSHAVFFILIRRNRQGLLVTFPEPRPICSHWSNMHFSIRTGQDVELRFVEESEVPGTLKPVGSFTKGGKPGVGKPKK